MSQMRNFPILGQQFDISKIFTYVAQIAGCRNINQFRVQVVPDGMMQQQAQAGNVIPLRAPGSGGEVSNAVAATPQMPDAGAALAGEG
jgi:hypothetical protein